MKDISFKIQAKTRNLLINMDLDNYHRTYGYLDEELSMEISKLNVLAITFLR